MKSSQMELNELLAEYWKLRHETGACDLFLHFMSFTNSRARGVYGNACEQAGHAGDEYVRMPLEHAMRYRKYCRHCIISSLLYCRAQRYITRVQVACIVVASSANLRLPTTRPGQSKRLAAFRAVPRPQRSLPQSHTTKMELHKAISAYDLRKRLRAGSPILVCSRRCRTRPSEHASQTPYSTAADYAPLTCP